VTRKVRFFEETRLASRDRGPTAHQESVEANSAHALRGFALRTTPGRQRITPIRTET